MKILFAILGGMVILASIAPLLRSPVWWIRGFDFPRLQLAVVGAIALAGFAIYATAALADVSLLLALAAAIALQLRYILPFSPLAGKQVLDATTGDGSDCISILIANVLTPNRRCHDLLGQIEKADPDVVLTLESDLWWQQQLQPLEASYPYRCHCPQDNLYGMHLYSKLELIDPEIRFLVEDEIPSITSTIKLRNGSRVLFYGLHPAPPSPTENSHSTERDGELLMVGKEANRQDKSVVVTGDLNDVAWSDTTLLFRRISGLLDPRIGRGMFNSFHAKYWFMRWPLDHLFHSSEFRLFEMRRLGYFGSDHFPIYIKLAYVPDLSRHQQGEDSDTGDHARARAKIQAAQEAGDG